MNIPNHPTDAISCSFGKRAPGHLGPGCGWPGCEHCDGVGRRVIKLLLNEAEWDILLTRFIGQDGGVHWGKKSPPGCPTANKIAAKLWAGWFGEGCLVPFSDCECGSSLPWHILKHGATHICSCERSYVLRGDQVYYDGQRHNPLKDT